MDPVAQPQQGPIPRWGTDACMDDGNGRVKRDTQTGRDAGYPSGEGLGQEKCYHVNTRATPPIRIEGLRVDWKEQVIHDMLNRHTSSGTHRREREREQKRKDDTVPFRRCLGGECLRRHGHRTSGPPRRGRHRRDKISARITRRVLRQG